MLFDRYAFQALARLSRYIPHRETDQPFTASEVLAALHPAGPALADPSRVQAILNCAAQPSHWTDRVSDQIEWQLGRLAGRLPSVVYWYGAGLSLEEIGRRSSAFGGCVLARRALDLAAQCIAERLNDHSLPPVRGAE